jgi:hypothetical protein
MAIVTPQDAAAVTRTDTTVIPTAHLPSAAQIDELAARVGVRFPDDYRAFLAGCGSLLVEVHEAVWERPGLGSVGPHWMQTRFALSVFGVCGEVEWLRIEAETARFRDDNGVTDLVPVFAWANTSDRICFDRDGDLVAWYRGDERDPLDESFSAVLERLLVEQRDYKDELLAR